MTDAYRIEKMDDVVTGMWKFHKNVSEDDLEELMQEMMEKRPYADLHIRKCSKDQNGIGFQFLTEANKYPGFFHEMTDKFRRRFGNDFVGWDVSPVTTIVHLESPSANQLAWMWLGLWTEFEKAPEGIHDKIGKIMRIPDKEKREFKEDFVTRYKEAVTFAFALFAAMADAAPQPSMLEEYSEVYDDHYYAFETMKNVIPQYTSVFYGEDVAERAFWRAKHIYQFMD